MRKWVFLPLSKKTEMIMIFRPDSPTTLSIVIVLVGFAYVLAFTSYFSNPMPYHTKPLRCWRKETGDKCSEWAANKSLSTTSTSLSFIKQLKYTQFKMSIDLLNECQLPRLQIPPLVLTQSQTVLILLFFLLMVYSFTFSILASQL